MGQMSKQKGLDWCLPRLLTRWAEMCLAAKSSPAKDRLREDRVEVRDAIVPPKAKVLVVVASALAVIPTADCDRPREIYASAVRHKSLEN